VNKNLNEILNYMKQYVENIYEHDSEPMLNWKDLKLVLEEIERLNNIINELEKWLEERLDKLDINGYDDDVFNGIELALHKLQELKENK